MEPFSVFAGPGSVWHTVAAAWLGLMFGSFLNVVIHRIPIMFQRELENYIDEESGKEPRHTDRYDLTLPRSACPHCGHQITAIENIPVFSYLLLLRGKCSNCKAPISMRYPLVELLTCVISAILIWHFGSSWAGLATLPFAWLLIAMTFIDFDTQTLPDDLTYPLLWLGLGLNALQPGYANLNDAVIGALCGYLSLYSVNALFKLIRKRDGMGNGDFKLLAALGAWFGWQALPVIILLSSIVGAVIGLADMYIKRQGSDHKIPFGPFLAGAGLIYLFYGKDLLAMYFALQQ